MSAREGARNVLVPYTPDWIIGLGFWLGSQSVLLSILYCFYFFPLASVGKQNTKDAKGQCGYDVFQLDELAYDETCCTKPSNHKE